MAPPPPPRQLLLVLALAAGAATALPESSLYPFGCATTVGAPVAVTTPAPAVVCREEKALFINDDDSSPLISLPVRVPFFDREYGTVVVNNNGGISFSAGVRAWVPERFPTSSRVSMLAGLWTDIDTLGFISFVPGRDVVTPNRVLYRVATNASDPAFSLAARDVAASFPREPAFVPRQVIVATWYKVGAYSAQTYPLNTFQVVLATDGLRAFAFLLYVELGWGRPNMAAPWAQAGFDAGDGLAFSVVPGSFEPDVTLLPTRSNVGVPGLFAFRVDTAIVSAGCTPGSAGRLSPRQGSVLGGTLVAVSGPCITRTAQLACRFGAGADDGVFTGDGDVPAVVPAFYVDNSTAACAAPFSRRTGAVPVYLSQDAGATWSVVAAYTYVQPEAPGLPALALHAAGDSAPAAGTAAYGGPLGRASRWRNVMRPFVRS